ncbi:MAG: metal-dependent hydrolase [Acidobacteriota bacterium]|nr:MAG: metal-dependent hydrolase [Acidobacteriota bacterium]
MPLPVAHGLIGASLVAASGRGFSLRRDSGPILFGAMLAMAPDLDLILAWGLGFGIKVHGGFSHSLVFALASGAALSLILSENSTRRVLAYMAAAASHGLLDACTKKEFGGAALLWPFSFTKYRLGIFSNYEFYPNPGSQPWSEMLVQASRLGLQEFIFIMPLFLLIVGVKLMAQNRRMGAARKGVSESGVE